jgi:amino acid adenylation domain-containing protein
MSDFLSAIDAVAAACPDRLAAESAEGAITYGALVRRSRALARVLCGRGVCEESLVGLCAERTTDLLVALLGILRSGGAYLPLDPALPADRLAFMLADARISLVVGHARPLRLLPPAGVRTVQLEDVTDEPVALVPGVSPVAESEIRPDPIPALAYVLYTSGSTGTPKGVQVTRANLDNFLRSMAAEPGIGPTDRVLALTTITFDIAALELLLPLTVGASIVLLDRDAAADGRALRKALESRGITLAQATPATWTMLLDAGWERGAGLKALSGGEALTRDLASAICRTGADFWNMYGPTETTVWSSVWRVQGEEPVLIGHPIANTRMYVLDERRQPVATGTDGELCIAGAGVARGYLNRPDLTAERFVPDPFAPDDPGGRMYRTGDVARRHESGLFECLGRLDDQVKIDGHRVEPGEIESALTRTGLVRRAVVTAVRDEGRATGLVAYVQPHDGGAVDMAALRRVVGQQLPWHMVPDRFIEIDRVPLTPSGKVDRRALSVSGPPRRSSNAPLVPPRTATERALLHLWKEILPVEDLGVEDDFFEMGGRSLAAARLFARLERDLGASLPIASLVTAPTIARLAALIDSHDRNRQERGWSPLVPMQPHGTRPPFFWMHPVGGHVFIYRPLVAHLGRDIPCYGIQAVGLDGVTTPLESVEQMAERHVEEIRHVQPSGPYYLGGSSFGGLLAFEMACRLRAEGETVAMLVIIDTEFPDCPSSPRVRRLIRSGGPVRLLHLGWRRARTHWSSFRRLGARRYFSALRSGLSARRPAASVPPGARDPATSRGIGRVFRANNRATARYVPGWYDGVLTYFLARDAVFRPDTRRRWMTTARVVDLREVPGDHQSCRREPLARGLAQQLRDCLVSAWEATSHAA